MATPQGAPQGSGPALAVVTEPHGQLPIGQTERLAWLDEFLGGMLGGGIYLLGGSPGGRKSGLATQVVLELAAAGLPSISVLTEESERRFIERATKITSDWQEKEAQRAIGLARCDARISDLEQLCYERFGEHFQAFHDLAACCLIVTRLRSYELQF